MREHLVHHLRNDLSVGVVDELARPFIADADFGAGLSARAQRCEVLPRLVGACLHGENESSTNVLDSASTTLLGGCATIQHMKTERTARAILARNVEGLMRVRGWSQAQLAKKAGVGQKTISNVVNARQSIQVDVIEALASALGVEVWQLFMPNLVPPVLLPPAAA